jgi:hypothetical protein
VRFAPRRLARLYLPWSPLLSAWQFLAQGGAAGQEELCFLAGRLVADPEGVAGQVTSCVLPVTQASAGYVTLCSHAQTALILDALERRREVPLMTLHTHGDGHCQHSAIDDGGVALTPEDGLLSGVVPYYALGSPFSFVRQTAIYERVEGKWTRLADGEKERRVLVHDEAVRVVPAGR